MNGYSAASAPARVSALKSVDLPAFGRPTMPTFIGTAVTSGARCLGSRHAGRLEAREVSERRSEPALEREAVPLGPLPQLARGDHVRIAEQLADDQPSAGRSTRASSRSAASWSGISPSTVTRKAASKLSSS